MIAGYLSCGGLLVSGGTSEIIGWISIVYGLTGLLGYFGIGNAPAAVFARSNMNSVILAIMGFFSILTGGTLSIPLILVTLMHIFDVMQGSSHREPDLTTSAYENS